MKRWHRSVRANRLVKTAACLAALLAGSTIKLPAAEDQPYLEYTSGPAHNNAVGLMNRAQEELDKGDMAAASRDVETILRTDPGFWIARYLRIEISASQRKWEMVIQDCNAGLKQSPTFLEFAIYRAMANNALGRYAAGFAELDHVIGLHSGRPEALSLALKERAWWRLICPDLTFHKPREEVADARQACSLMHWKYADDLDTLASAYADAADFDSAIQTEDRAMKAAGAKDMESTLQAHAALFRQHRAIRSAR